jgi:seryl-tRNA synthetase
MDWGRILFLDTEYTLQIFRIRKGATMLDLNLIREKPDTVRTALKNRQLEVSPVDDILRLDEKRRSLLTQVESLKAERNAVSKEIGRMKDAAEFQRSKSN